MFGNLFLGVIERYALAIAQTRRGEDHLQSLDVLNEKFQAEQTELAKASEQWDELPDVCYYAACMAIVAPDAVETHDAITWLSQEMTSRGVQLDELESATIAKYRRRQTHPKDILKEREDILETVRQAQQDRCVACGHPGVNGACDGCYDQAVQDGLIPGRS